MSAPLTASGAGVALDPGLPPQQRRRFDLFRAFRRKRVGYPERVALVLIVVLTVALLFAAWIAPHAADEIVGKPFVSPSGEALLGTDARELGGVQVQRVPQ